MATTLSRRGFLKAGLIGAVVLAAGGGLYRMTAQTPGRFVLDDTARSILAAIIPVMLKDGITPDPAHIGAAIIRVQDAIAGLTLQAQKEVSDLFGLLALAPTRRFLAGVPDDWPQAKQEDVAAFLQSWRVSRVALFQAAYQGLHDLIAGPWYADESAWASIGYPGPIKELS
ncbi:MAG TPA: twin-arginine translocation signal domain-containing protein [Noviherbaspirillum sp.]|uniref:twin-arginine translocation signal domain-containing protein n=1 Tax=Noviherbaspirillum sp. TaxID=1926288 RepID=UPI002D5536D3|nr:twin-arginine translocation signal domain-containing protein [Noviherbaspirillum sp.]HYD96073.1 twin-arginine translocation signal domain-containing protein [Noviherbaspirillum sp.]